MVKGVSDVWVKLARCCTPVPGDDILGFVTRGGGVSVHRRACTNAAALLDQAERLVEVEWAPSADSTFVVSIQVEALDRHRLLSDVTRVLSDERVSILSATVSTNRDRVAVSKFTFEMAEAKHLGHLLRAIRNVEACTTSTACTRRLTDAAPSRRIRRLPAWSGAVHGVGIRPHRSCWRRRAHRLLRTGLAARRIRRA